MKILCLEDGSLDIDKLEQEGLKDGGIIVYRQGSTPPYVVDMCADESVFKVKLNSLYGKTAMNEPSEIREYKIDKLQEWVESEIRELKSIKIDLDYPNVIPSQLGIYQKVLQKIKELNNDR